MDSRSTRTWMVRTLRAKVVGLLVGRCEGALQDRRVIAGAGRVFVVEPLLQVVEGEWLACVEELRGDGGAGPVAGQGSTGIGLRDAGLAA
jgi:hypothetical protein